MTDVDFNPSIDYFSVLEISSTASADEIKKSYKDLLLRLHPDKNIEDGSEAKGEECSHVVKAFRVLTNPVVRKKWEAERKAFLERDPGKEEGTVWKKILLDDMEKAGSEWRTECRCGGEFTLDEEDLAEMNLQDEGPIFVECETCSLIIEVKK